LYLYFDTRFNPADDPTRGVQMWELDLELPGWWHEVCEGSFVSFDQRLLAHGAAADLAGVDFGELCSAEGVDLRPQRARRRDLQLRREEAALATEDDVVRKRNPSCLAKARRLQAAAERADEITEILKSFPLRQFFFQGAQADFTMPGGIDLFSGRAAMELPSR
jgi:hypothetical protein